MNLYEVLSPIAEQLEISVSLNWKQLVVHQVESQVDAVGSADIFVAIRGTRYDSHKDLAKVADKMPVALIVEDASQVPKSYKGVVLKVESSRRALALISHQVFQQPTRSLFVVGVTGTNGKTSVTCILQHLLERSNIPTARIGTIGHFFGEKKLDTLNTTPGPIELCQRLKDFNSMGAKGLVMEVSSHALDQYRVDGVHFNVAIFTNLSHDHLDYHKNFENYFLAKSRLFGDLLYESRKFPAIAVVNMDDPYAYRLPVDSKAHIITYGKNLKADIRFEIAQMSWEQTGFDVFYNNQKYSVQIPLIGEFNVSNFVACAAALTSIGMSVSRAASLMVDFEGIPGRMQRVQNSKGYHVFVDYAHSPDALNQILQTLKTIRDQSRSFSAKIWTVFGCGGDRDQTKRPKMAQAAEAFSDHVVVTSDNPRSEDPNKIMDEILMGFTGKIKVLTDVDRAKAIELAIKGAQPGDVVVIAGKGHEEYQEIQGSRLSFSDYSVAQKILENL